MKNAKPQKLSFPIVLPYKTGSIELSSEQRDLLFTREEINKGEKRGEMETFGPWQLIKSYRALCVSSISATKKSVGEPYPDSCALIIWGYRTLGKVNQSGYELEGKVSVNGKNVRGFTSSQMFSFYDFEKPIPAGQNEFKKYLFDCATIHACDTVKLF